MFNDYMWQTYLNAGGRDIAETFRIKHSDDFSAEYADFISELHKSYCPSEVIDSRTKEQLLQLSSDAKSGDLLYGCYPIIDLPEDKECSIDAIMQIFHEGIKDGALNEQEIFNEFSSGMEYYSLFLHIMFPDMFVPYYFRWNFNIFEKIAQEFEIELPPIPIKKDYEGRFFYYGEICGALLDFREKHNMSPYELCAFLYDFAPKYVGGIDSYIIKDLPEPKSAFFIGGSKDDEFLAFEADTITPWQCNPNAVAGDIAVMYIRTPICSVNSVWHCASNGFIDPFFYYYRCVYIAYPEKITRVPQKALESDSVFKDVPIVRKNMQGINGVELSPSQYNHLLDVADSTAKRLVYSIVQGNIELMCEKDVENKLIKPLLEKLDYTEKDYEQQVHIEVGNHNNMLIPDFLLMLNDKKGQQSAFAVIEAKYSTQNKGDFEAVKIQARSYARQILARYSVIADKNKIWISSCNDDFTEDIFVSTWDELNNPDIFSKLYKLIGRKSVK
ncbi:MAG: hypothetical protein ACI4J7_00800 [Ruminiclostridium sp.]